MLRRVHVTFRILSVVTLLQGLAGLVAAALDLYTLPFNSRIVGKWADHPAHLVSILYLMAYLNLAFAIMLLVAGTLLWKLRRKGLLTLVSTLVIELIYFLSLLSAKMYTRGRHDVDLLQTIVTAGWFGNFPLSLQLLTAFPIVAGILALMAYAFHKELQSARSRNLGGDGLSPHAE